MGSARRARWASPVERGGDVVQWPVVWGGSHTEQSWAKSTRRGSRSIRRSSHGWYGVTGCCGLFSAARRASCAEVKWEAVSCAWPHEDHCAVVLSEGQRLVPWCVAGRRDDPDSWPHFALAAWATS